MKGFRLLLTVAALCLLQDAWAETKTVAMLPSEHWWGVCNNFGREMPFTAKSDFACDLRKDNYAHQSLSLLVSDKGGVTVGKRLLALLAVCGRCGIIANRFES